MESFTSKNEGFFCFYQFLQPSATRSPGFTSCQSDPLGHEVLLESSPSTNITVGVRRNEALPDYLRISRVQNVPEAALHRHSSLETHAPSWRTRSPGQPQVFWQPGESKHSVSPWKSEQERGHGFPQGHSSCPPQSAEAERSLVERPKSLKVQRTF